MKKIFMVLISLCMVTNAYPDNNIEIEQDGFIGKLFSDGSGHFGRPLDLNLFSNCTTSACDALRANPHLYFATGDFWGLMLTQDAITDKKKIAIERKPFKNTKDFGPIELDSNIYLRIDISTKGGERVCVVGNDFPYRNGTIRVDKNKPITTNSSGCVAVSASLRQQLSQGSSIVIRGYHWPYDYPETQTISLDGYNEVIKFLNSAR